MSDFADQINGRGHYAADATDNAPNCKNCVLHRPMLDHRAPRPLRLGTAASTATALCCTGRRARHAHRLRPDVRRHARRAAEGWLRRAQAKDAGVNQKPDWSCESCGEPGVGFDDDGRCLCEMCLHLFDNPAAEPILPDDVGA